MADPRVRANAQIYQLKADLARATVSAARRGVKGFEHQVQALAAGIQASVGDPQDLVTVHKRMARAMQAELVQEYERTVERRKRGNSYRVGRGRYAGGVLGRALRRNDMVVGDADGIKYLNTVILNTEARHWARLNFGTKPAHTPNPEKFGLRLGGRRGKQGPVVARIGLRANTRPAFSMPVGYWTGGEAQGVASSPARRTTTNAVGARGRLGGGRASRPAGRSGYAFYPTSRQLTVPTKGIVGRNYADAGLRKLAEIFPEEYGNLITKWLMEASPRGQAVRSKIKVRT